MTGKTWMSDLDVVVPAFVRFLQEFEIDAVDIEKGFGILLSSLIVAAGASAFAWSCCDKVGKQFVQLYFPSFPVVKETLQEASPMEPNKPKSWRPTRRIK